MALGPQAGSRELLLLEARVSYLEQILAQLHIYADPPPPDIARTATGETTEALRRWGGGIGPIADRVTPDIPRLEALLRQVVNRGPHGGDPPAVDLARLSATQIESVVHDVNAEIIRLRSIETMLNERLKEMRGKPGEDAAGTT